jgi:hypothetical protein
LSSQPSWLRSNLPWPKLPHLHTRRLPFPQTRPPQKKTKKWTNENISSTGGKISVVGTSDSLEINSDTRAPESSSYGATFIYPKLGQIVHPGDALLVDLAVDPGVVLPKGVTIISPLGYGDGVHPGPPYSFLFHVPESDSTNHHLIGPVPLYAMGSVASRPRDPDLAGTTVEIEEAELPSSLTVTGGTLDRYQALKFYEAGQSERIEINAKFPNGHDLDITNSTYLKSESGNPFVILVADDGTVSSVGPGNSAVIVTYTVGGQQKRIFILVYVEIQRHAYLEASPSAVNFGDVPAGTPSPKREITLTNNSSGEIRIDEISGSGKYPETCAKSALPPGVTCTFTVSLTPHGLDTAHTIFYVSNSVSGTLTIPLIAKGI